MLVEVIKPYRRHKIGAQIELKEKDARILLILKKVRQVSGDPEKTQKLPVAQLETGKSSTPASTEPKKRGRKLGSKNKAKDKPE